MVIKDTMVVIMITVWIGTGWVDVMITVITAGLVVVVGGDIVIGVVVVIVIITITAIITTERMVHIPTPFLRLITISMMLLWNKCWELGWVG